MLRVLVLFPNTMEEKASAEILSKIAESFKGSAGLISINVNDGAVMSPGGPPMYSNVLEVDFESLDLFMAWVKVAEETEDKEMFMKHGIVRQFYNVKTL